MDDNNTNYPNLFAEAKNLKSLNAGQKLKTVAKILLILGLLSGIILGIVMFSKAGESKETYFIGDTASGLFTWLGFGFLLGLPALSIVHYFLLNGLGNAIELLSSARLENCMDKPSVQEEKAAVLRNQYGFYCSKCGNYVAEGDYECMRCKCKLVYPGDEDYMEISSSDLEKNDEKPEREYEESISSESRRLDSDANRYGSRFAQRITCPSCHTELKHDARFCSTCGRKMD